MTYRLHFKEAIIFSQHTPTFVDGELIVNEKIVDKQKPNFEKNEVWMWEKKSLSENYACQNFLVCIYKLPSLKLIAYNLDLSKIHNKS